MQRVRAIGHVAGHAIGIVVGIYTGKDAVRKGFAPPDKPWSRYGDGTGTLTADFGDALLMGMPIRFWRLTPKTVLIYGNQRDGQIIR